MHEDAPAFRSRTGLEPWEFELGDVDIVQEVDHQAGGLPLLQYALTEVFGRPA